MRSADRIEWQVCASKLEASLTEVGLIQTLRPRRNIAAAFSFLYPFIGIQVDGADTRFCLTTCPKRSRRSTSTAPFARARSPVRRFSRSCVCSGSSRTRRPDAGVTGFACPAIPTSTRSVDSRETGPSSGRPCCVVPRARRWRSFRCACWTTQGLAPGAPLSRPSACGGTLLRRRGLEARGGDRRHRVRRLPCAAARPRRALPTVPRRYRRPAVPPTPGGCARLQQSCHSGRRVQLLGLPLTP